jgi:predicted ATPase
MKIDIHVHTKKTKQGDAETREIEADRFHEIISSTEVKIIAITNHNVFDIEQYRKFVTEVGDDFQIWPGVELDVIKDNRRGHLIVIVSPDKVEDFSDTIFKLTEHSTPDKYTILLEEVVSNLDKFMPLYIAHYHQKKPDLLDEDIDYIVEKTANKSRVLKEATNAVSAGIFISHGHASIHGSDVQNWNQYQEQSKSLPDLRLPVESFEQFCLLLDKDQVAINTLLDKKDPEPISIKPFKDETVLEIIVYDDINVFFGAKGTGKSDILTAIAGYYSAKGITCKKFESGSVKLDDAYDLAGKNLKLDLKDHEISYCNKEIELIRLAQEVHITSISKYKQFFSDSLKNKKAQKIKIKDMPRVNTQNSEREFELIQNSNGKVKEFKLFSENNTILEDVLGKENMGKLLSLLNEAIEGLDKKGFEKFSNEKSAMLFNSMIEKFKFEITKKTGAPAKPSETGFQKYASNRIKIELAVKNIIENISKKISINDEYVGNLGEKGELYCKTEIVIQDGNINEARFKPLGTANKKPLKNFSRIMADIKENVYSQNLFNKIAELNEMEGINLIPTTLELIVFDKYFTINDEHYEPSTGEASMILLHRELSEDKDIYILDEPEKSLGNEYINNVIVPLIKEKAKSGKKIFIATHDANIAVRTLPYNSVYRHHDKSGYQTFVGNPFTNNLTNINNHENKINWKDISMRTLEGGRNAFGERGQIYGNA